MDRALFVPDEHMLYFSGMIKRVVNGKDCPTGVPENDFDIFFFETLNQGLGNCNFQENTSGKIYKTIRLCADFFI
jgi:hypothetical protein